MKTDQAHRGPLIQRSLTSIKYVAPYTASTRPCNKKTHTPAIFTTQLICDLLLPIVSWVDDEWFAAQHRRRIWEIQLDHILRHKGQRLGSP